MCNCIFLPIVLLLILLLLTRKGVAVSKKCLVREQNNTANWLPKQSIFRVEFTSTESRDFFLSPYDYFG